MIPGSQLLFLLSRHSKELAKGSKPLPLQESGFPQPFSVMSGLGIHRSAPQGQQCVAVCASGLHRMHKSKWGYSGEAQGQVLLSPRWIILSISSSNICNFEMHHIRRLLNVTEFPYIAFQRYYEWNWINQWESWKRDTKVQCRGHPESRENNSCGICFGTTQWE